MAAEIVTLFAQFGLPSLLTLFFFGWFFGRYLPRQNNDTERRFSEMNKTHLEALRSQERVHLESLKHHEHLIKQQSTLYESSMHRLMQGYAELRTKIHEGTVEAKQSHIELKNTLEKLQYHLQNSDKLRRIYTNGSKKKEVDDDSC